MEIGARVGAVLSATDEEVRLLGWGVYEGDQESPLGFPNPRIRLDDGRIVWGYQCWWGPEEKMKTKFIEGRRVIDVKEDIS